MKSLRRICVTLSSLSLFLFLLMSCSSGGGGGNNNNPPPPDTVSIQSTVNTGITPPVPVANATCQFVDNNGVQQAQATADGNGDFLLAVPPQLQGTIQCTSQNLAQLALLTFASTQGAAAGDTLPPTGREVISPQSTLIAILLAQEKPADPEARKTELLAQLADPNSDLATVGAAAAELYQQLLQAQVDTGFHTGSDGAVGESGDAAGGGDGIGGGGGGDTGVSGDVGDGAEFSPIPGAICEAVLKLNDDTIVSTAILQDLLADAQVSRADIPQDVAASVNQALAERAAEIAAGFANLFPKGIGLSLRTTATGDASQTPGHYFLPVPPHIPVYIRCRPPEQENLVLATYVKGREEDEKVEQETVNPALTIFSTQIAATLETPEEVAAAKENFLHDIRGLHVKEDRDPQGNVRGFTPELEGPTDTRAGNVRLVVFTATALYTTLLKKDINTNYRNIIGNVVQKFAQDQAVDPVDIIAATPEIPPEQAEEVADLVNESTDKAEPEIPGANRHDALSTARILVRVQAESGGGALSGATVTLLDAGGDIECTNCPQETNEEGEATLELDHVPADAAEQVTVRASLDGFVSANVQRRIIALATATAEFQLEREAAMSIAHVEVSVREARGGNALPGAEVTLRDTDGAQCTNCPQETDENGRATLELDMSDIPVGQAVRVTVQASLDGFITARITRQIVAPDTVEANFRLQEETGSGGGTGDTIQ